MGIRGRMVSLSLGIAVPFALVGLALLWGLWQESRGQLDESLETQSELAAVAFERWVDGQRQPLTVIADQMAAEPSAALSLADSLPFVVNSRPYWLDIHLLDASDNTLAVHPRGAEPLRPEIVATLRAEAARRKGWAVATDWTRGEGHPIIAIAARAPDGSMAVARVEGEAVGAIFSRIKFADKAVVVVFDPQHRVLYRTSTDRTYFGADRSNSPLFVPLTEQQHAVVEAESPYDGVNRLYGLVRVEATDCVVAVGVPTATLYRPARLRLSLYLLFSLLAVLCALGAALLIARHTVVPVRRLGEAAKRFGAGELAARADVRGGGELEELGAVFNDMAEEIGQRTQRLEELDRLKSEFVGGVSHELRTPLTTIKTLTRVLQRGGESEEERREYLETIAAECDRQIDLVLNLLDLTRIEAGAYRFTRSRVDVAGVVEDALMLEHHAAEARSHRLGAELPAGLPPVVADPSALRRVLCGLVENAIKYTPDGGRITLSAREGGDTVALSVADTGRGIRAEDIPHVFEKFYRGRPAAAGQEVGGAEDDEAAGLEAPGVGLGLYLAKTVVTQMGGSVGVESVAGHGSIFTVHLPVWREESVTPEEEGRHAEAAARG